jgi:alkylated DNA nucleotide flippase Atl1
VVGEPRLHLVGYGPAASTIGATRAARRAVAQIVSHLDAPTP